MKKIFTLLYILFINTTLWAQIVDNLTFSINQVQLKTENGYTRIVIPSCNLSSEVGHPELPCVVLRYLLPYDQEIAAITILDSTLQLISSNALVYPKQPEYPINDTATHPFVQPNESIYNGNAYYPLQAVQSIEQYYEKGYHLALIKVYPVRYTPALNRLELFSSIRFQLNLSNVSEAPVKPKTQTQKINQLTETFMRSQIRNVSDFDQNNGGPVTVLDRNASATRFIRLLEMAENVDPEYIIITNDNDVNGHSLYDEAAEKNMTDVFQEFADWKTQKGIPTKVVTIDEIAANYLGCDVQEKIHNFLADVHQHYGSPYVLFGGDVNVVPARMILGAPYGNHYYPVDLYYVAVETSWDYNGNGEYGELALPPNDNIDHADNNAEFYFGRAPVEDVKEALAFVNKSMDYETLENIESLERNYIDNIVGMQAYLSNPPTNADTTRLDKMEKLFDYVDTGSLLHSGITQNDIIKWRCYDPYGFPCSVNYEMYHFDLSRNNALACFGGTIPTTISKQAHIVLHSDHSSYLTLGASSLLNHMTINRQDIDGFSSNPYNKIVFTVGCSPGEYDKDCIAERLLNKPDAGAVAVCASSQTSWFGEEDMFKSFITDLYEYEDKGVLSNPLLFNLGLIHYKAISTYSSNSVKFIRKNHLFGDPELPIWTREPVDLTVSISPSTITNQNNQLTVSVSGMAYSEYATNDVMVCVMKEGEVYLREAYNGTAHSHDFVFEVNPETAGELKVTVTGHNYIPYETTVPVSISGKNVYVSQKVVQDASGNNDGKLDAGETVHLGLSLKNNGTVNLTNVHATLSCEFTDATLNQNLGSYLTLTTANATYGTIAKNATVTRNNYQFTLSDTVPDRSALQCTLTIYDGTGQINTRFFVLPVGAPNMEYVSVRNEVKNRRVGIDIELVNMGFGTAKGVTATLSSQDPQVAQITQGTYGYGSFARLESKTGSFEYIPVGTIGDETFTLTVTDTLGKSWLFDFDLNVITDTVDNLTFENTERSIRLRWSPETGSKGYNVYRSEMGHSSYEKLNNHPLTSSAYNDLGLEVTQAYYYGVTFLDGSGNESPMARITAWTSLPVAAGWPVSIPDTLDKVWGTAPNVADIDGDGKKEIFLTAGTGDNANSPSAGGLLGFNYLGEELYDIDHNPTTVSGFANPGVSMTCTPAIGDIDNDGIMEVVVATRDHRNNNHRLYAYKNSDADHDGIPDHAWDTELDYKNFNGVVLADLDDNGTLEIIAPNQGRNGSYGYTYLEVFNASGGRYYSKDTIRARDYRNQDGKAVTMPVVADLDNDGYKEIVFGLEGGVYSWSCHSNSLSTLVPYSQTSNERTDCPVIAADIDGDGDKEILYMAIRDGEGKGYIRSVNPDSTSVSGWSGDTHFVSLSNTVLNYSWPPYFCVADIDRDGDIEIFAADRDTLKMWNSDGTAFGIGTLPIPNLDGSYFQPLIADIDGNGDCEIIVPSQKGYIYAYKPNGNAVPGWPLVVPDLATIPAVADLDGDGYNEVVAASQKEVYVWHTAGESRYNQCDRFRYNRHNNAVYEIPCSHVAASLEISGTQVWNDDRRFDRDVIVNGGASLTVKSELKFSSGSRIVVKKGGRLVVDGGRLSNACPGGMWRGIEVWGDSTLQQQPVNGAYLQGYLELKNGAVVENALCAVNLQNPLDDATTGGVVHATGAVFRNNAKAVHIGHYTGHDAISGDELSYNSWFRDCSFTVDGGFMGEASFNSHVRLDGVNGVTFSGCAFTADRSVDSVNPGCFGIDARNSLFMVNQYCSSLSRPCPEQDVVRSSFTGFHMGIHAVGDGQRLSTPQVYYSDFSANDIGVFCRATGFATLVGNSIAMGDDADCSIGLYADGVTGLTVEENDFYTPSGNSSTTDTYGTVVIDSRTASDIYLNSFSGLDYGNLSIGQNAVPGLPPATGLTYTCNDNTGNVEDFHIADKTATYSGIQPWQGSGRTPAGNTFSGSEYHIYNDGDYSITYYYDASATGQTPDTNKLHGVTKTPVTGSNSCRSHYGGGSSKGPDDDLAVLEADFAEAESAYNALRVVLASRIDGGDTQAETAAVNAAHADNAPNLKARLLSLSPYLSQRVLLAAAKRSDILSETDLSDILWANPDELGRDTLLKQLEDLGVLSKETLESLRQRAGDVTERTGLEAGMASYAHDRTLALGGMVRGMLCDTVTDNAALRGVLARFGSLDTDRLAVTSLMAEGDTAAALALAGTFPVRYGLSGGDLDEHNDYMRLLALHRDLMRTGRPATALTAEELAAVEKIAGQGRGLPRAMAETLLGIDAGDYNVDFCPTDYVVIHRGGTEGKGGKTGLKDTGLSNGMFFRVSPVPATGSVTMDYILPEGSDRATLELTNTLGLRVMTAELEGNRGSKTLDISNQPPGMYFITVTDQNGVRYVKKIVKQ